MNYPSGITEEQFVDVVNAVANVVAQNYSFGYYDPEDIRQECFCFAIKALPKFDPSKSQLSTFLSNHIKRRLINLRRDKLTRKQTPCVKCQQCQTDAERNSCKRYRRWQKRNGLKRSLMESIDIESSTEGSNDEENAESIALRRELVKLIDRQLPAKMRSDYRRFVEGVKISAVRRDKVLNYIRRILGAEGRS